MPSRIIWISVALLFLWFSPIYGMTEPLLYSVRVGNHGKFSRVVFEFNNDTPYEIIPQKDRFKITVEFDKLAPSPTHAAYWVSDPIVKKVSFIDTPTKIKTEITLKKASIVKEHFRLNAPPRIVLDITHDTTISLNDSIETHQIKESPTNEQAITNSQEGSKIQPSEVQLDFAKYYIPPDKDGSTTTPNSRDLNYSVGNTYGPYSTRNGGFLILNVSQSHQQIKSNKFLVDVGRLGFLNLQLTSNKLGGTLVGTGEMIYSPYQNFDQMEGFREYQPVLLRFGLKGNWGRFDYGVEYLHARSGANKVIGRKIKGDQEGSSLWLKQSMGVFKITALFSDFVDNVADNPGKPRIRNTQGGITFNVALPNMPLLNVYYTHGYSRSVYEPSGSQPQQNWLENFGATLYYSRSNWDISVSSTSGISSDKLLSDSNSITFFYQLSGSYRPITSITISPALSLGDERYMWSGGGVRYITPTASIWFGYYPLSDDFNLSFYGSYTINKSNDGYTDTNALNGTLSLVWTLARSPLGKHSLSFDVSYYHYLDDVYESSTYKDISALLNLKLASF